MEVVSPLNFEPSKISCTIKPIIAMLICIDLHRAPTVALVLPFELERSWRARDSLLVVRCIFASSVDFCRLLWSMLASVHSPAKLINQRNGLPNPTPFHCCSHPGASVHPVAVHYLARPDQLHLSSVGR